MKKSTAVVAAALIIVISALCLTSCGKKGGTGDKNATTAPKVALTAYSGSELFSLGVAKGWEAQNIDDGVMLCKNGASYVILITAPSGETTADAFRQSLKDIVKDAGGEMLANRSVGGVDMAAGKYTAASGAKTLELRGGNDAAVFKIQVNDNSSGSDGGILNSDEVNAMLDSIAFK